MRALRTPDDRFADLPGFGWAPRYADVGGLRMSQTKKLRDVQNTGRASIVVDDVLPPWQPRMIEIRGTATVLPAGGKAFGERFEDTIVRIKPTRIISFGIDSAQAATNARSVGTT